MNSVDKQYFDLIRYIKEYGVEKLDRTGTGTKSIFSYDMRFKMSEGFPLLTSKKMAWKAMVIELLWFLKGDTNIKYLVDNGCMIWVGDAYKNYTKYNNDLTREEFIEKIKTDDDFASKWGELGPVYGKQWRKWDNYEILEKFAGFPETKYIRKSDAIDQIQNLINDLKTNPDSRRLMVNAWNVGEIDQMVLPPCHYGFQCYTRALSGIERWVLCKNEIDIEDSNLYKKLDELNIPKRALSLKWNQRSVDTFLGLPFNIASYGLLLHLLAKEVNMIPEDLIFSGGDVHIYLNHIEPCNKQLKQKTYTLPTIEIANKSIFEITYEDIKLIDYKSSPAIKGELSN